MSQQTPATTTERKYRCDNCLPLWDRSGNVKGIQLCDLHASVKDLLAALKAVYPMMVPGMRWSDDTGQLIKSMVADAMLKARKVQL